MFKLDSSRSLGSLMRVSSILFVLLLLAACGGSADSTAPSASIVGVWDATAVNGAALPADVHGAYFTVVSDQLTVGNDGLYVEVQAWKNRQPDGSFTATQTSTDTGRWAPSGSDFSFRSDFESATGPPSSATFSGNSLSVSWTYNTGTSYSTDSFQYKRH
jgi:hypothetical protein